MQKDAESESEEEEKMETLLDDWVQWFEKDFSVTVYMCLLLC